MVREMERGETKEPNSDNVRSLGHYITPAGADMMDNTVSLHAFSLSTEAKCEGRLGEKMLQLLALK